MPKIVITYYKNMLRQNIILLLTYFNVFMIIFYCISEEYTNAVDNHNIFTASPPNACYVCNPFYEGECVNEQDFLNNINEYNLDTTVGYEIVNTRKRTSEGQQVLIYVNNYLTNFCYPIKNGRWFDNKEYDGVVIGGSLSKKYDVGDSILLYTEENYDEVKIIGNLGENYTFMFLNRVGDELNYSTISTKSNDDIIVTNCIDYLDKDNIVLSTSALVIDQSSIQSATELGINTEKLVPFRNMSKVRSQSPQVRMKNRIIFFLILLSIIFCIAFGISLYSFKSRNILCLLWKQGMNNYQLTIILMIPQVFNVLLACTLQLLYRIIVKTDTINTILYAAKILYLLVCFILVYTFFVMQAFMKKYILRRKKLI